jgi:predicted metal-dependent phosphoesterase TrpH
MTPQRPHGRIHPDALLPVAARRQPGHAAFELHAHASERSLDSGARAVLLAQQAAQRGLDGLCLTDHNALCPEEELRELSERAGITVLAGMELGTDAGHVLVYGLPRYAPELLLLERLRSIVEYEGAAMVLAHPMRPFAGHRPALESFPLWFEGLEVINGDNSDREDGYWVREAQQLRLATVGGSDAHSVQAVGRVATLFPGPVQGIGDLVRYIRSRQSSAIDLRPLPAAPLPPDQPARTSLRRTRRP